MSATSRVFLIWHVFFSNVVLGLAFLSGIYLSDELNRIVFLGMMATYIILAAYFVLSALMHVKHNVKRYALMFWHLCFTIFLVRVTYLTLTTL